MSEADRINPTNATSPAIASLRSDCNAASIINLKEMSADLPPLDPTSIRGSGRVANASATDAAANASADATSPATDAAASGDADGAAIGGATASEGPIMEPDSDERVWRKVPLAQGDSDPHVWRKVLYLRQPFDDTHTDPRTFLADMRTNAGVVKPRYWSLVRDSSVLTLQVRLSLRSSAHVAFRTLTAASSFQNSHRLSNPCYCPHGDIFLFLLSSHVPPSSPPWSPILVADPGRRSWSPILVADPGGRHPSRHPSMSTPSLTRTTSPPVLFSSPPVLFSSPPVLFSSPPVLFSSPPVLFSSPPVLFSSPPVLFSSPPVLFSSPPVLFSSPPVLFSSPPVLFSSLARAVFLSARAVFLSARAVFLSARAVFLSARAVFLLIHLTCSSSPPSRSSMSSSTRIASPLGRSSCSIHSHITHTHCLPPTPPPLLSRLPPPSDSQTFLVSALVVVYFFLDLHRLSTRTLFLRDSLSHYTYPLPSTHTTPPPFSPPASIQFPDVPSIRSGGRLFLPRLAPSLCPHSLPARLALPRCRCAALLPRLPAPAAPHTKGKWSSHSHMLLPFPAHPSSHFQMFLVSALMVVYFFLDSHRLSARTLFLLDSLSLAAGVLLSSLASLRLQRHKRLRQHLKGEQMKQQQQLKGGMFPPFSPVPPISLPIPLIPRCSSCSSYQPWWSSISSSTRTASLPALSSCSTRSPSLPVCCSPPSPPFAYSDTNACSTT
ncbi:unnamed protein product [Closterium sp. NIES-65]|nr:unnamed protein product [Closterium sp. NIES-65]